MYQSLVSQADTKLFQSNPTLAAGDFKISIDGGAFANLATLPTVTPASGKAVKFSFSAAEMTGDNIIVMASDAAGAEWCDQMWCLQTTARQIDDLAYPTVSGRSTDTDADGNVDARLADAVAHGGTPGSSTATIAAKQMRLDNPTDYALFVEGGTGTSGAWFYGDYAGIEVYGGTDGPGIAFIGGAGQPGVSVTGGSGSANGVEVTGAGAGKRAIVLADELGGAIDGDLAGKILGSGSGTITGVGANVNTTLIEGVDATDQLATAAGGAGMTTTRSTGALLGTDETTGVTIASGATGTGSQVDLLADNTSTGTVNLFLKWTAAATLVGDLKVTVKQSRVTGQPYTQEEFRIPVGFTGGKKLLGKLQAGRYITVDVENLSSGSITNAAVLYELEKVG